MLYNFRRKINTTHYNIMCSEIYKTPPLKTKDESLRIVTMLQHQDLTMYLLACKALYQFIQEGKFVLINDGSLTRRDLELLDEHLDEPEIIGIDQITTGRLPRGGCWERLIKILELASEYYVIQLDADTLTLTQIPEVLGAYRENTAFTLGTRMGQSIISFAEASALVANVDSEHVQVVAEKQFSMLPPQECGHYVRGCSAFAGFPRGMHARDSLDWFSSELESRIGKLWREWGSEQVASNFIVANARKSMVLPYPKYASYEPTNSYEGSAFLHFLGSYRFNKGTYLRYSKRSIADLLNSHS